MLCVASFKKCFAKQENPENTVANTLPTPTAVSSWKKQHREKVLPPPSPPPQAHLNHLFRLFFMERMNWLSRKKVKQSFVLFLLLLLLHIIYMMWIFLLDIQNVLKGQIWKMSWFGYITTLLHCMYISLFNHTWCSMRGCYICFVHECCLYIFLMASHTPSILGRCGKLADATDDFLIKLQSGNTEKTQLYTFLTRSLS